MFPKGFHPKTEFKKGQVSLVKGKHWKIKDNSKRKGHHPKSEFKKGIPAWNKGIKKRINTGRTHFKKGMIPWNKGKKNTFKHTDEAKRKISESESGEKHYNWQGGIANEPYSVDWTKTLKRAIKERDKFTCRICEEQDDLVIHHIDYDKKNCNSDNLITLCRKCHTRTNTHRDYWTNYFQNKLK